MTFALFLDIIVACLLAGTIFYVWQLSSQLARFRQNRQEMDRFIRELSTAIERANLAIAGMRAAAETSGAELHKRTRSATEISDELQLMIESANNMATRLERAASAASSAAMESSPSSTAPVPKPYAPSGASPAVHDDTSTAFPAFAIRDPEFDPERHGDNTDKDSSFEDEFESESERELFRALQGRRKG